MGITSSCDDVAVKTFEGLLERVDFERGLIRRLYLTGHDVSGQGMRLVIDIEPAEPPDVEVSAHRPYVLGAYEGQPRVSIRDTE